MFIFLFHCSFAFWHQSARHCINANFQRNCIYSIGQLVNLVHPLPAILLQLVELDHHLPPPLPLKLFLHHRPSPASPELGFKKVKPSGTFLMLRGASTTSARTAMVDMWSPCQAQCRGDSESSSVTASGFTLFFLMKYEGIKILD